MNSADMEDKPLKHRPLNLQPRERLMNESADCLTEAELLAILLRTGTRERDVLALSETVLKESGGLEGLLGQNMQSLCAIKGIGQTKACTLLATIEIGRRLVRASKKHEKTRISDSQSAAEILYPLLRSDEQETFFVIYLDAKNQVIHQPRALFIGTINGAHVHLRDIFREAVKYNAVSLIVGHNHPSGDVNPSKEDLRLTKRIQEAADIIGVRFLDHIILATSFDSQYLSFRDKGYLD